MTLQWNPLRKAALCQKPSLSQGFANYEDDRLLELSYVKLQELEENTKKVYKEVKRSEDCLLELHRAEEKLASDLCNSEVCQGDPELKTLVDKYVSVNYQMGHSSQDLVELGQRTVVEPMKKLAAEFPQIQASVKKRDVVLGEVVRNQQKLEKLQKLERTGQNIVKTEQTKKCFQHSKEDFEQQNRILVMELPQFYEKRVEYFQPSLQALIRSQVDYYGESTRLFSNMISGTCDRSEDGGRSVDQKLQQIKSLSIVGC